jgi:hydroxybutyrate-dimer hydrolase
MIKNRHGAAFAATALALAAASAIAGPPQSDATTFGALNRKPVWLGDVHATDYDGVSDDLLTAGLGKSGLQSAVPPAIANPLAPTAAELRRLAIYNNYRALVDTATNGGFGVFFGPNVDNNGNPTSSEGKVAGTEYIAYDDDGSGSRNVTLMVQVPSSFDPQHACIITATSSGSRGIYGAISTGEWGLKHGCAVAYTDKGTGAAPHDLQGDTVPLIDGTREAASVAGTAAQFNAHLSPADLATFNAATPYRFAFKNAHSQQNAEKDWGRFTLQAVRFAFYVLNERYGKPLPALHTQLKTITPQNTVVIASSVSNGGGAAVAAAELDHEHLIDGVAAGEPNVEMPANPPIHIQRGSLVEPTIAKPLFDYISYADLYQSCASQAASLAAAPGASYVIAPYAMNRCASLHAKGLLSSTTPADQANEALQKLQGYGWEPESLVLHPSLAAFEVDSAVAVTYAAAYARASVKDNLCGYSFAYTDASGNVGPLPAANLASMFATGNGVPPAAGVQIVNNLSVGGPLRDLLSVSPSTGLNDFNLDGVLCMRNLLTGTSPQALTLQQSIDQTRRNGDLHGKPALIVQGRSDALLPVNHTGRAYTALNKVVEHGRSQLSYIEVENAQHFDAFIDNAALPGYDSRMIPLHLYEIRALDAMYAHLTQGTPLPGSQVVRTVPRGGTPGAAPALTSANVPPIAAVPAVGNAITMQGNTLVVPD